jgi:hypothetical protein
MIRPLAAAAAALLCASAPLHAENLTKATRDLLAEAKLDPSIMAGLDQELAVPQAMIDGAKKEGLIKIRLTVAEKLFDKVWKVFAARYPGIDYEYVRGIGPERAVVALVAFKRGTYVSDVVGSSTCCSTSTSRRRRSARSTTCPRGRTRPTSSRRGTSPPIVKSIGASAGTPRRSSARSCRRRGTT